MTGPAYTWEGKIIALAGDQFTAELYPTNHEGRPFVADFALRHLGPAAATAVPGDVIDYTVPANPRTGGETLRLRRLGPVTPADAQAVYDAADGWLARLEPLFDEAPR